MDKSYIGSTFILKRFVGCSFTNDIVVVDDTSCTSKFWFPIIGAIAFDDNKASELIAFELIQGKSIDDFIQFFCKLPKKFSIRVFVCDRLRARRKSILKYFKSHIFYYRLHIRRNITPNCNDGYAPEELIKLRLRSIRTSNGTESYKTFTNHDILTIDECVKAIILRYKMLITKSLSLLNECGFPKDLYSGSQIGIEAHNIILKQYNLM